MDHSGLPMDTLDKMDQSDWLLCNNILHITHTLLCNTPLINYIHYFDPPTVYCYYNKDFQAPVTGSDSTGYNLQN